VVFSVVRSAAVAGKQLGKYVPAATDTIATIEERYFLYVSCREVGAVSELSSLREAETPLLEAVASERLVKAQQAGKRFSGCCGDS
jgi:hypothetical protein